MNHGTTKRLPNPRFVRSAFGERIIRHAMRDRATREHGRPDARVSPMFTRWEQGIFSPISSQVSEYVEASGLLPHKFLRAVNSSQAFAFNLLFPFRVGGSEALGAMVGGHLGRDLRIRAIDFEFRGASDVLGEWRGESPAPTEPHTTADVGVIVEDASTEERGIVLLEVKLSEEDFTNCNGATSPANKSLDVCASAEVFAQDSDRCYLRRPRRSTKDRAYWDIFRRATDSTSLRAAFPRIVTTACPFRAGFQQIMRNYALALGLVQRGEFQFSAFGLVHHDQNPDVVPIWDAYAEMTALPGLFRQPASTLVASPGKTDWWTSWQVFMRERYDLPVGATKP